MELVQGDELNFLGRGGADYQNRYEASIPVRDLSLGVLMHLSCTTYGRSLGGGRGSNGVLSLFPLPLMYYLLLCQYEHSLSSISTEDSDCHKKVN